ncbi:unnamed protein product, partial [Iphiclides podalirius]
MWIKKCTIKLIREEWQNCARAAAAARVLEQLERGNALRRLARHHHAHNNHALLNGGELMDEKAKRLMASIRVITAEVKADPSWEGATQTLLECAELTVERAAFARLYLHVLFPNGDGDIARDQVLSEHMRRLAACTSALRAGVAPRHLWAAPYPHAQTQLRHLPVYRTPRDKVLCIMRCVSSIMSVLALTDGSAPSADDLTPVLVYVILKVNPPSLLSTIELVNALGGSALSGEALYWWTQFCAAASPTGTPYSKATPILNHPTANLNRAPIPILTPIPKLKPNLNLNPAPIPIRTHIPKHLLNPTPTPILIPIPTANAPPPSPSRRSERSLATGTAAPQDPGGRANPCNCTKVTQNI